MDGGNLVMVMDVVPFADTTSKFSDKVQYVFHTQSGASLAALTGARGQTSSVRSTRRRRSAAGPATRTTSRATPARRPASTSMNGKFKVFAGLRDDPFFFNLEGFKETVATVDGRGELAHVQRRRLPGARSATSTALVTQAEAGRQRGAGKDAFAGANVLSIVVSVDKSVVTPAGPVVAMWASTNTP